MSDLIKGRTLVGHAIHNDLKVTTSENKICDKIADIKPLDIIFTNNKWILYLPTINVRSVLFICNPKNSNKSMQLI